MVEEEIQRLESVALRLDEQSLDDATGLIKRLYEQSGSAWSGAGVAGKALSRFPNGAASHEAPGIPDWRARNGVRHSVMMVTGPSW